MTDTEHDVFRKILESMGVLGFLETELKLSVSELAGMDIDALLQRAAAKEVSLC